MARPPLSPQSFRSPQSGAILREGQSRGVLFSCWESFVDPEAPPVVWAVPVLGRVPGAARGESHVLAPDEVPTLHSVSFESTRSSSREYPSSTSSYEGGSCASKPKSFERGHPCGSKS